MQIIVAKHAGFCYGVKRAYDMTLAFKEEHPDQKVYTYGDLIHNNQVLASIEEKGIYNSEKVGDLDSKLLVIRAHGVDPSIVSDAREKGFVIRDATCPYVKKIHVIAKRAYDRGDFVVIIGDAKHPEVIGIVGNCRDRCKVVADLSEARAFLDEYLGGKRSDSVSLVAQTTFNEEKYHEIIREFRENLPNFTEHNTICSSTEERQRELRELAEICDFIIVLGGKHSSNTKKLYEILISLEKKAIHIEKKSEIRFELLENCDKIGIVAGASTPQESIDEIVEFLATY